MQTKLTPLAKLLIVAAVLGGIAFAAVKFDLVKLDNSSGTENGENGQSNEPVDTEGTKVYKIGVVTWGGYAGGQYFNRGFKPNNESLYFKEYGFHVEFVVEDDFIKSREIWKAGEVDMMWATIDAFTTEMDGLKQYEPQVVMQADWSRGGDAIVVRRGINTVADLKGKSVAFAEMTPSHTFLLWMLEAGNLKYTDIQPKIVASATDAAVLFKTGQVDAAVVWSPDDADCVQQVAGSKVLQNTREASNIIADVFVVKKSVLEENREDIQHIVEGWLRGAAEINSDPAAKTKAVDILYEGLGLDRPFWEQAIDNVRLCTYGDNQNFFGLNPAYKGVNGQEIYQKMELRYKETGYISTRIPSWSNVGNPSLIQAIQLSGPEHAAEGQATFTEVTEEVANAEAISTKPISIMFPTGAFVLDENMKYIIDMQFLDIAKSFANARIRIEGNTDNVGNRQANVELSRKRAQAVADYLIQAHGFDANRFIVVGNGPDKPVAENNSPEGQAQNRRTEFQLLPQ